MKFIKEFWETGWKNVYTHHKNVNDYRNSILKYNKKNQYFEEGQWVFTHGGELIKIENKLENGKVRYKTIFNEIKISEPDIIKRPATKEEVNKYFEDNL